MVPRNSIPGGFAYICQSKGVGIIAIKTERTQIHFLRDVLVEVALLDLKVPTVHVLFVCFFFVQELSGSVDLTLVTSPRVKEGVS